MVCVYPEVQSAGSSTRYHRMTYEQTLDSVRGQFEFVGERTVDVDGADAAAMVEHRVAVDEDLGADFELSDVRQTILVVGAGSSVYLLLYNADADEFDVEVGDAVVSSVAVKP